MIFSLLTIQKFLQERQDLINLVENQLITDLTLLVYSILIAREQNNVIRWVVYLMIFLLSLKFLRANDDFQLFDGGVYIIVADIEPQ